ncbi:TIGR02281 family clan AA aspartic protease [Aureimonas sp. AU12]|uniref:retropepsin-like aspartic protease family protein n=1 Tax=Aureimonas sp. AU12 TaxID=1638161 RepID=UPI0007843750|nr:TIGR02281 family clan AA aspartic protease [Aureimonas sp. AU12]
MSKILNILTFGALLMLGFPSLYERYRADLVTGESEQLDPAPKAVEVAAPPSGRSLRLDADADGHFRAQARFNGRPEPVLVDTGATYVAVSDTTARRLGVRLSPADFRYTAETANGPMPVAMATIDRLSIGGVEVRDVEAMVAKGNGLGTTLLGMSFLKKLKRYGVENGRLTLVQ